MAKFALNIYGENDKVVKTYETDIIRYGVIEDTVSLLNEIEGKSNVEQFKLVKPLIKAIFNGLTDEEIKNADYSEVMGVFNKLVDEAVKN